jgi:glycosyltransferase involved in cell wall biosynthesis
VEPLRLLTLVLKEPGIAPNQRYRHEQWAPYLERDHGIRLEFEPFESPALTEVLYRPGNFLKKTRLAIADAWRRWLRRTRGLAFDGVIVLRQAMLIGGPWIERWLARQGVPLFYDFDDPIWLWQPSLANGVFNLASAPWKVGAICRLATAVTVGNEYLASYARRYSKNVHVVRTSIDSDHYPQYPDPGASRPFTLVWTGSHSTLSRHLETIRAPLEHLATRRPVVLRVICDAQPAPFERVALEFVPWCAATEAADLAPGHVGLMPLPDNPETRGKCGCKALQYMAIGRPVVVSPIGINSEIVRDGVNGLWATTPIDWETQIERLANDAALRTRLGVAGRQTVLDGFTARASAAAFATVVHTTLARAS